MEILEDKGGSLSAPSELTIRHAEALLNDLRSAFSSEGPVELGLGAVEKIDAAAMQVLLAGKKTAKKEGREFVLSDPSDQCRNEVTRLGLETALFGS